MTPTPKQRTKYLVLSVETKKEAIIRKEVASVNSSMKRAKTHVQDLLDKELETRRPPYALNIGTAGYELTDPDRKTTLQISIVKCPEDRDLISRK